MDRQKQYVAEHKPTTACTLRLVKHYFDTGRIVIADALLGSVRTVLELLARGLYSIVCVKQGCAGYPRACLKEMLKERGD